MEFGGEHVFEGGGRDGDGMMGWGLYSDGGSAGKVRSGGDAGTTTRDAWAPRNAGAMVEFIVGHCGNSFRE